MIAESPRARQLRAVREYMQGHGNWALLEEISSATGAPEASASARLRQLRKLGYLVQRRRYGFSGLWAYRVTAKPAKGRK